MVKTYCIIEAHLNAAKPLLQTRASPTTAKGISLITQTGCLPEGYLMSILVLLGDRVKLASVRRCAA